MKYEYSAAISRNIGWVTADEQERLRSSTVCIAGLGGVGGVHALTLARMGVGNFRLADFDQFDVHNFNRQAGAFVSTLGRPKSDVIAEMVAGINPTAKIQLFRAGISSSNVLEFLSDSDIYVDGLDFFALQARRLVFGECERLQIPAITAAPLGMGFSVIVFGRKGMSFERYFRFEGQVEQEQYARFIAGLSPAMLQRHYLVEPGAVSFREHRGPSTAPACELCAGVTGATALKLLLGRGPVRMAPWALQFDAYLQRMRWSWRPFGNANPLQQALLRFIRPRIDASPR